MPGVTLNEAGEIFVNGRKVDELLLGSRSFMRGNKKVLMENLPYYTVQNIKVYDKQSDKSKALGYDVDPKQFVMDVNLKQEYQRGYIANVEGAVGTEDRWLARAFALGFSDHYRFTLLGNLNNVNETRHIFRGIFLIAFRDLGIVYYFYLLAELERNETVHLWLCIKCMSFGVVPARHIVIGASIRGLRPRLPSLRFVVPSRHLTLNSTNM